MNLLQTLVYTVVVLLPGFAAMKSRSSWRRDTASLDNTTMPPFCAPDPGNDPNRYAVFTEDQLWDLQVYFWDHFISPANDIEAQSINSSLLAPDIQGGVDVVRTFDGQECNTEYLFGLFSTLKDNPDQAILLGYPTSYDIVHFAGSGNVASASTLVQFTFPALGLTMPVMVDTWNQWNADCQVLRYDATLRWFDFLIDTIMSTLGDGMGGKSKADVTSYLTEVLANSICTAHETSCLDENKQWDNRLDCHDFLTNDIRFGAAYEFGRNTLLCRMLHQNLVPLRPSVHCPHIGPGGGGMCDDDTTYVDKVKQKYFTSAALVPSGL